jgi:lysophospholipase
MSSSLLLPPVDALPQPSDESKVLVIYTGGTIGMLVGSQGYVPEPNFLTDTLRCQSRFHDPLQDSLFSNAASVKGYREWSSSSGRSTPRSTSSSNSLCFHSSLTVRSSRPIGRSELVPPDEEHERGSPIYHYPVWHKITDDMYEARVPSLVTPRSTIPGGGTKRIRYAILEVSINPTRR